MYTVTFHFDRYRLSSGKPVIRDYIWWVALVGNIAHQADNFQIRCWPDEPDAIATGQRFGTQSENTVSSELVYQGSITEDFIKHICSDGFDENGGLKWFTIFFKQGEQCLFRSELYGTEPYIFLKTEEQVHQLVEWSKQYPIISRIDQYGES
jgi:hypothetical protein